MPVPSLILRPSKPGRCRRQRKASIAAALALAGIAACPLILRGDSPGKSTGAGEPQAAKPAQQYQLSYKFAVNQDVHMELVVDSEVHVQKGPFAQSARNQSVAERHFHVESVEADGSAVLQLFIDNVKLTNSFDSGPAVSFDSRSKVTPPQFEQVRECIGKLLTKLRVDKRGRLLSITRIGQLPGDDAGENFLDVFPDHPIHVGDEWMDDIKVAVRLSKNLQQKITLRRRYQLISVNGNLATIHIATAELTQSDDPVVRAQLIQKTPQGTIRFDLQKGMVTSRELTCARTETGVMGEGSTIAANSSLKGILK